MKYRTKLYIALTIVALLSSLFGLITNYIYTNKRSNKLMREHVTAIAATTASLLPPDLVQTVIEQRGTETPQKKLLTEKLNKAQNSNRDELFYLKFIYIITVSPTNPNEIIFVVGSNNETNLAIPFGTRDPLGNESDLKDHLDSSYTPNRIMQDQWGSWMSGYSPVFRSDGSYLATVGANYSLLFIKEKAHTFLLFSIWGFCTSFAIALIGAHILSKRVTKSLSLICDSVKDIGEGNLSHETHLSTHDEFNDLAEAINAMAKGLREREHLKVNFARYVSKHVLEQIMQPNHFAKLQGERKKITVLFSDIRRFTTLSEHLPPEQVVRFLNEYFEAMIDIIFANQGTLDKFIGDGLMVEFGAPLEDENQEKSAVQTALEMQKKIASLREKWCREGKPKIQVGIGIHTGLAVVGNIGSEKRMEYTAIGDTVNIGSKLEQATKILDASIIISEEVYDAVKDIYPCKSLGSLPIQGRTEEIRVYAVLEK